jgi:two-component system, response regulator / RNA-binding antiterminator
MRHEVAGTVPGTEPGLSLTERVAAARSVLADNTERLAAAAERLRITRNSLESGRSRRQLLHESAYARLRAQLETMPAIEQAKGILIAQTGCSPDEAFTLLRQASQRSNVRVSELAASIVDRAVTKGPVPPGPGAAAAPGLNQAEPPAD